ncbi:folylpolyglutamate synthase [Mycobacterium tuberculosis]|nr:folylpolyglutamate synthase [Mycobacterium tuberculosis]
MLWHKRWRMSSTSDFWSENLRDAIDVATSLVDDAAADPDVAGDAFSRTGIVITGSVVTAGAARTLFGRDPQ